MKRCAHYNHLHKNQYTTSSPYADQDHSANQSAHMMILSPRKRLPTSKRRSVILVVIGALFGQFITRIITYAFLSGQSVPCTQPPAAVTIEPMGENVAREIHPGKELLFVGVMTSRKYLPSRAKAIYSTWGSALNGSLIFFVGRGDRIKDQSLPVEILDDVRDDSYPPQRKSFAMLEAMFNKYGQRYEWFMRADDDLFVDVDQMRTLLSSLNSSRPLYLGHPGTGKVEETGKLGLPAGKPYCMGGTGVVLSRTMMEMLAGRLYTCLNHTVSAHEDSELGRCVYNVTGISCVQSSQIHWRFKQNYDDTSGQWIHKAMLSARPYVTFHPVKDTRYMYHSAALAGTRSVAKLQAKLRQLSTTLACLREEIGAIENRTSGLQTVGCPDNRNCTTRENSLPCQQKGLIYFDRSQTVPWFLIDKNTFYTLWQNDLKRPAGLAGVSKGVTQVLHHLSAYVRGRQRHSKQRSKQTALGTFYRRVLVGMGLEYVTFVRDASSTTVWPYVIRQGFDDVVIIEKDR